MQYSGTLYYDDIDNDEIEFISFIKLDKVIMFDAITTWKRSEKWQIISKACFNGEFYKTDENAFSFEVMCPSKKEHCQVSFTFVEGEGAEVIVEGYWFEKGDKYPFSGTLKRKNE